MEHLKGALLKQTPILPINIRLVWKGLPGTKTLAYYENLYITAVKGLITLTPEPNVVKLFLSVSYEFS